MFRNLTLAALTLGLVAPLSAAPVPEAKKATVDVALCLDVSGSMRGLIDSAKIKLWDIVNDLGKIKPTPNLRVALYSYGHSKYDSKAGWVRKEVDLTTDLDTVYEKLNALTINGGTELVARVSHRAILDQPWSDDTKALKMIFVCGNESASQDKTITLEEIAKQAKAKDIVVNTIFCNSANSNVANGWKHLAQLAGGRFANIDQNRNVIARIQTPFDKKMDTLSSELNKTYVTYGGQKAKEAKLNQLAQDANARRLGTGASAGRAASKASGLYRNEMWDLVDRLKRDSKFDITKIPAEQLSDEMKKLKPEERVKYVKEKLAQREKIQKEIAALHKQREAFIKEKMKAEPSAADKAFDSAVRGAIREQAKEKGIDVPK